MRRDDSLTWNQKFMLSSSRISFRVISRVEVSLCHLAEDALGSTGCGVGRCSRYLENHDWLNVCWLDLWPRKIVKETTAIEVNESPTIHRYHSPSVARVTAINSSHRAALRLTLDYAHRSLRISQRVRLFLESPRAISLAPTATRRTPCSAS